jgi:ATP-dependent helicase IRC3
MSFNSNVPDPKSITYIDYEHPFSLIHESSGAPHIAKMSSNAWVGCGGDVYILECLGKGHIRIESVEGKPFISFTPILLLTSRARC